MTAFHSAKDSEKGGWKARDASNYDLLRTHIPSLGGGRDIYYPKSEDRNVKYERLQCSRGLTTGGSKNINELVDNVRNSEMFMRESDMERVEELEEIVPQEMENLKTVAEMGFRVPRLLDYYKGRGVKFVKGYDVVGLNVEVGKKLGFDVEIKDFNDHENLDLRSLGDVDLLLSYHVFEHLSRPDIVLKKIYDSLKAGALLHVEVPIGPYGKGVLPEVHIGHLFSFHDDDMNKLLTSCGFKIIFGRWKTTREFIEICSSHVKKYRTRKKVMMTERYIAQKE